MQCKLIINITVATSWQIVPIEIWWLWSQVSSPFSIRRVFPRPLNPQWKRKWVRAHDSSCSAISYQTSGNRRESPATFSRKFPSYKPRERCLRESWCSIECCRPTTATTTPGYLNFTNTVNWSTLRTLLLHIPRVSLNRYDAALLTIYETYN